MVLAAFPNPTPNPDNADDDWKDVLEPVPNTPTEKAAERKGLCINCALAFASTLGPLDTSLVDSSDPTFIPPREHWMSRDEYKRAWRDRNYRAALFERARQEETHTGRWMELEADYAERLLSWPRCDDCPTWISEDEFRPSASHDKAPLPRRCNECSRRARLESWIQFPEFPIGLKARVSASKDEVAAFWIAHHASKLIGNAWISLVRSQPRCDDCPTPAQPTAPSETGLEKKILNALAAHGEPMSVGDLLAAGIKGLTKNNIAKVMKGLEGSGAVLLTTRGPAKLFELP